MSTFLSTAEMANSGLFSEDHFLCPICLDVFTRPVSIPCGHNFCMPCIASYWDEIPVSKCPVCKETFQSRPSLKVNTFISELASQIKSLHVTSADAEGSQQCGAVPCDFCSDKTAVKSCIDCRSSYCDIHLGRYHQNSGLNDHTLTEPVVSFDTGICMVHKRRVALFCRDDSAVLCDVCANTLHINHNVIPVQVAYKEKQRHLVTTEAKMQQMIQERMVKVQETKQFLSESQAGSGELMARSVEDFTNLVSEMKKNEEGLLKAVEEKQKTAEEEGKALIQYMEREISMLREATTSVKELRSNTDPASFLHKYPNSPLPPHTLNLSTLSFNRHREMQLMLKFLRKSVSELQASLSKLNVEISRFSDGADMTEGVAFWYARQFEADVTLDPDTAHPLLTLSPDGKAVRYNIGAGTWENYVLSPSAFTDHLAVLGERGFISSKFYFEVYVGQKTEWSLGVISASVQRSAPIPRCLDSRLWAIWFMGGKFETFSRPDELVLLGQVERVGVFVDYDTGLISFYDVIRGTAIYSFTQCVFTEELYPYFNPCDNEYGSNLDPMVIVGVSEQ